MESSKTQSHICPLCGFTCALKSGLEYHIRQHTGEKPFVCDKCNREFPLKISLSRHMQRVHLGTSTKHVYETKYNCSLCTYTTVYKSSLQVHTLVHTRERAFPCQHQNCSYVAASSKGLRSHTSHKHNNKRLYLCRFPDCDYRGKTAEVLKRHSLCHGDYKPYVCDVTGCNFRATRKDALNSHQAGVHAQKGSKSFACAKCNHRTHSKKMLTQHQRLVHTERSIKCNATGCAYSCRFERQLKRHILDRHMPAGTFKCDFAGCKATAANPEMLLNHKIQVHEEGHKCPFCDFRAKWHSIVKKHIERHHTKKRILCPTKGCSFQAIHRDSLRLHMLYHKANLSCPVDGCGYSGISSNGWKLHMRVHDPTGRPFKCHLCPKYFYSNCSRSAHLRSHMKEKPFRCPTCNYGSTNTFRVTNHVRSMHSNIFKRFVFDKKFVCDHCGINFGCAVGLAMHNMNLKTAVVVLQRLQVVKAS